MIITGWNPETEGLEKTYITSVVQAASNSINVKNADRIPSGSIILVGEMGMEQSELLTVNTGGTSLVIPTTGNTKFAHTADEPIYKMRYDQILFYRSSTVDGTYTLIASETIDVDNKEQKTEYLDTTGTSGSFYKTKYRNSSTLEESQFSDVISAEGYPENSIGEVMESVVSRVKDKNYTKLSSDDYLDLATEVNNDLTSQSERPYEFMRETVLLNRVKDQSYVQLPSDYYKFDKLWYSSTMGGSLNTKRLEPIPYNNFKTSGSPYMKSDVISRVTIDDSTNRILIGSVPMTNGTGAFELSYYAKLGKFTDLSQIVKTPNSLVYRYKFMAEFYAVKAEVDPSFITLAKDYATKYGNEIMKLQRQNRKDVGTNRSFMDSARDTSNTYSEGKRFHI